MGKQAFSRIGLLNSKGGKMKNFIGCATILLIVIITLITPQTAVAQSTIVVDKDGQADAADCNATMITFASIQAAVDAASPSDTIFICPGIYDEQVTVTTNNLTITGSGVEQTVIRPSIVYVNSSGSIPPFPPHSAIFAVKDTSDVVVEELTVDGSLADGGSAMETDCHSANIFVGINYRNSSGEISNVHVTQIQSATYCALGVKITSSFTSPSNVVKVSNSLVDYYTTGGILCGGPTIFCNLMENSILGLGPIENQMQFGVGIQNGAGGELTGNIISDHYFSHEGNNGINYSSVGIYLAYADPYLIPHILQENTFYGNEYNFQIYGAKAVVINTMQ